MLIRDFKVVSFDQRPRNDTKVSVLDKDTDSQLNPCYSASYHWLHSNLPSVLRLFGLGAWNAASSSSLSDWPNVATDSMAAWKISGNRWQQIKTTGEETCICSVWNYCDSRQVCLNAWYIELIVNMINICILFYFTKWHLNSEQEARNRLSVQMTRDWSVFVFILS